MEQQAQQTKEIEKYIYPSRPQRSKDFKSFAANTQFVHNQFPVMYKTQSKYVYIYTFSIKEQGEEEEKEVADDARRLIQKIIGEGRKQLEEAIGTKFIQRGKNIYAFAENKEALEVKVDSKKLDCPYNIILKQTSIIDFNNIPIDANGCGNAITQFYNINIKEALKQLGYIEIGRNAKYFNSKDMEKFEVVENKNSALNVWIGFSHKVHLTPSPLLEIDFSSRVLRRETVLDYMDTFPSDEKALPFIVGHSMIATYGNNRIYKIDDVVLDLSEKSTFEKDGKQITYKEYFEKTYKLRVTAENQPLLLSNQKIKKQDKNSKDYSVEIQQLYFLPELMKLTGMTDDQRQNQNLMKDLAQYTKRTPQDRMEQIVKQKINITPALKKLNINVSDDDLQFCDGYLLDQPELKLGRAKTRPSDRGSFNLKETIKNPYQFQKEKWTLIHSQRDQQFADRFLDDLIKASAAFGIRIEDPAFIEVKNITASSWVQQVRKDCEKYGKPDILVSFIPKAGKTTIYPELKKLCCTELGIPYSNIVSESLRKNTLAVCSKFLLQMNAKLGYPLWETMRPKNVPERTMIIGIDKYHKLVQKKKSCIGFVASMDDNFSTFWSKVSVVQPGEELHTNVTIHLTSAIKEYFKVNGKKYMPENIIIFRDGVGEGQIESIVESEIKPIVESMKTFGEDYNPGIAVLLINKKSTYKYFAKEGTSQSQPYRGGKSAQFSGIKNPKSGSVICGNTQGSKFDFFLCAQNVTQGTCTPTYFNVVYNSTTLPEDAFLTLTYNQCFNYYNWTGAVRVPAPVQYAHKLAFLVGDTFQSNAVDSLSKQLYFL